MLRSLAFKSTQGKLCNQCLFITLTRLFRANNSSKYPESVIDGLIPKVAHNLIYGAQWPTTELEGE